MVGALRSPKVMLRLTEYVLNGVGGVGLSGFRHAGHDLRISLPDGSVEVCRVRCPIYWEPRDDSYAD